MCAYLCVALTLFVCSPIVYGIAQSINVKFLRAAKTIHSLIVSSSNSLLCINICSYVCRRKRRECVFLRFVLLVDRFSLSNSRFFPNTVLAVIPTVTFFVIAYTIVVISTVCFLPRSHFKIHNNL